MVSDVRALQAGACMQTSMRKAADSLPAVSARTLFVNLGAAAAAADPFDFRQFSIFFEKMNFSKIAKHGYFDIFLTPRSARIEFSIKNYLGS